MSMDIQRILDLKRFDDPTRPAARQIPRHDNKIRVAVEPGDGTHYEVQIEGDVVLLNVGEFASGRSRCMYAFPWCFHFLDNPSHKMNSHTVSVYRWLVSVASGSDFIEIPPRWQPRQEGGL